MTLIIGIKCNEGIVLASDGAVSSTITQQTKKLNVVHDCVAFGSSGTLGLSQRLAGCIESQCKDGSYSKKEPHIFSTELSLALRSFVNVEVTMALSIQRLDPALSNVIWQSGLLLALPILGSARLFLFNAACSPTEATDSLPYFSIGSGSLLAEPFLAFVRRLVWKGSPPNLTIGMFSALWALEHAIHTSPTGVTKPVQFVILRRENGSFRATELSRNDLDEHREAVKTIENIITAATTEIDESPPAPPDPPS